MALCVVYDACSSQADAPAVHSEGIDNPGSLERSESGLKLFPDLLRELDQLLHAQPRSVPFPENMAAPSSAGFGQMLPDLASPPQLLTDYGGQPHGGETIAPQIWRSPFTEPAPAAETLGVDAAEGNACLIGHAFGLAADAVAPAAKMSGSQPAGVQLHQDSRGEPVAGALSGASQVTRCSESAQMTGLRSSGHSAAALQSLDASPKQSAPEQRLLPEPQRSLGVGEGLDMQAPSWPRASRTFPDQTLRSQLMAPPGKFCDLPVLMSLITGPQLDKMLQPLL